MSPSGPPGLFKGVTTATSGVMDRFPLLLPVRNPVAGYGASAVARTPGVGVWGVPPPEANVKWFSVASPGPAERHVCVCVYIDTCLCVCVHTHSLSLSLSLSLTHTHTQTYKHARSHAHTQTQHTQAQHTLYSVFSIQYSVIAHTAGNFRFFVFVKSSQAGSMPDD